MRDSELGATFRLIDAVSFDDEYYHFQAQTAELQPIVQAFKDNMQRILVVPALLGQVAFWSSLTSRVAVEVVGQRLDYQVTGLAGDDVGDAFGQEAFNRYHARIHDRIAEFEARGPRQYGNLQRNVGMNHVSSMLDENPKQLAPSAEALFYSMIIGAYSAFESLAGDMWVQIVNMYPEAYAGIKGDIYDKPVTIGQLKDFGFDVRDKVGLLVKQAGKVDFQSLGAIKSAYEATFGKTSKPYNALTSYPDLSKIAKVRNLIAHRAGRVDTKFIEDSAAWPEFSGITEGQFLPVHGKQVRELIDPCTKTAVQLMTSLDSWAMRYAKRKKNGHSTEGPPA